MENVLLTAAALLLSGAGPVSGAPAPLTPPLTGKLLYAKNCARCHGLTGRAQLNGAHDLTKSNLNAFGRTYLVTKGLGKMPSFSQQLTGPQIQAVVAYSLTLR